MLYSAAKNIVRHRVCKTVGDLLYALRDIDAKTELSSEMGGDYVVTYSSFEGYTDPSTMYVSIETDENTDAISNPKENDGWITGPITYELI
jgi:hypothetical protein